MIGPEINHRNVDLYHLILNGAADFVTGSGSIFQTWLETASNRTHAAIDITGDNEHFAFHSGQLPELAELLSSVDAESVRSRYTQWLRANGNAPFRLPTIPSLGSLDMRNPIHRRPTIHARQIARSKSQDSTRIQNPQSAPQSSRGKRPVRFPHSFSLFPSFPFSQQKSVPDQERPHSTPPQQGGQKLNWTWVHVSATLPPNREAKQPDATFAGGEFGLKS